MKILKKSGLEQHKFKVLKSFLCDTEKTIEQEIKGAGPTLVKVGDLITVKDFHDQVAFIRYGRVTPELPPTGIYIVLASFELPGRKEKFECKKMELVELKAQDAVKLLLDGFVIPKDDSVWRPFGRSLKQKPKGMTQKQIDEYEAEKFKQKNWEMGILQKGK